MIYAGDLIHTLEFYSIQETQSASGHVSTVEKFMFKARAERCKNKQNYVVDANELYHTCELTFRLRYRKIEDTWIVVYEGNRYNITSIDDYRKDNEMVIILNKINE